MAKHFDVRLLVALGAVFLWGCPIDDAQIGSSGSSSGSASSSSGDASSSSSGIGGAGGTGGGAAGMGGAVASSSSGGMGGAGGMAGAAGAGGVGGGGGMGGTGGMGGGPVCPEPGTVDSCGKPGCPDCSVLVMIATGAIGVTGTFVSSNATPWVTSTYGNEPSTHAPALVAIPGKNKAMALLRRTGDALIRYATWTPVGFSSWNSIGPTVITNAAVSADATDTAIHVSFYGTNNKHFYAQYTDGAGFVTTAEPVNPMLQNPNAQAFGPFPASIAALPAGPIVAYSGQDEDLYTHARDMAGAWPEKPHMPGILVAEVPAIAAFEPGAGRELLCVFMEKSSNQLHWIDRKNGTMWSSPSAIAGANSTEPVLLTLPSGDAILAYCDTSKKVWWTRFTGATANWSAPQQLPGDPLAKSKPALALGAGDAEVELLFVDDATGNAYHARLHKGAANFTMPSSINGATNLVGIAAATNL